MKKKILFTAFNLDTGGVEKCLVNLANNLDKKKYDITIYLQVKEGAFLKDVKDDIKVLGYDFYKIKNKLIKKTCNIIKFIKILINNYHKYDYSVCYAPGYIPSSILALVSSKKNAAWMHTNIITYMQNYKSYLNKNLSIEKKCKKFINRMFFRKYKNNIFVSEDAERAYLKIYPQDKAKTKVIYNLLDYQEIIKKSKEKIDIKKSNIYTFVNIGRQTEFDKRLSRIITASYKLKQENYKFQVLLIGSGSDTNKYKEMVKEKKLEKIVKFIDNQNNPYPYFKLADTFVLSSAFEGLPTTIMESLVLNIPIISTDVSDVRTLVDKKYGIVVNNNDADIYMAMKSQLENPISINKVFDSEKYFYNNIKKVERLLDNE